MQVPQRQPQSPLIIWVAHRITCKQLVATRVANSPMWNCTMFSGSVHNFHHESSLRYLASLWGRGKKNYTQYTIWKVHECPLKVTYLSLNGVLHKRRPLQSGPLCRAYAATTKLYRPPITPTAAKAIDRNICRRWMIIPGQTLSCCCWSSRKGPYYSHFQIFVFHLWHQWSSLARSVIQKVYRTPESCIFSPLFTASCKNSRLLASTLHRGRLTRGPLI